MADGPDMDRPVTRRELREELASYPTRIELHESLGIWAAELERRISVNLSAEMARQFHASEERMRDYMRALLEPHDGVPDRVTTLEMELEPRVERLEAKVFAPRRRRAAKRR